MIAGDTHAVLTGVCIDAILKRRARGRTPALDGVAASIGHTMIVVGAGDAAEERSVTMGSVASGAMPIVEALDAGFAKNAHRLPWLMKAILGSAPYLAEAR